MKNNKKLTSEEVKHVAGLANLPLSEKETKDFPEKLSETIDYIDQLKEIPAENTPPTYQVTGKTNAWRSDKPDSCRLLSPQEALANAKKTHNGFFVTKVKWS